MEAAASKYWGLEGRRCGTCATAPALLHCAACPRAYYCGACDARAHASPGATAAHHARVWVCEVCEHAPGVVTCRADAAVLCAVCDADIHAANPLAQRHERVPVTPLLGPAPPAGSVHPGGAAASAALVDKPPLDAADPVPALWLFDHQIGPGVGGGFNLNLDPKSEPKLDSFFSDLDPYLELQFPQFPDAVDSVVPAPQPIPAVVELDLPPSYQSSSLNHSVSSSEVGVVPEGGGVAARQSVPAPALAATGEEREARLMRYREKRKNRRFEKTIRYASRKAYAEVRPRIKGRFAKRSEAEAEAAEAEAAGFFAFAVDAGGFSVVPSF